MKMKKILILSPFYYPEKISTGKYNTYLSNELIGKGNDVDVICSYPIYPEWKVGAVDTELEGIKVVRGGKWLVFPRSQILRRAVLELWYMVFVLSKWKVWRNRYDIIVPIFPPSLFFLIVSKFSFDGTKLIGIVHDLQGIYATYKGGRVRSFVFKAIAAVERKTFKGCDKLIFLSNRMRREAVERYSLDDQKSFVHYPFVTINEFNDNGRLIDIIDNEQLTLVYSGALGEKQAPEKLLSYMQRVLDADGEVNAYIFSHGPVFERLKSNCKHNRVKFLPLVAEDDLPELILRSTVQIVPQEIGTSDGSLPSKLPNLLAAGGKIVCITDKDSELVTLLADYSKSVVSTSWEDASLVDDTVALLHDSEGSSEKDEGLLRKFSIVDLADNIVGDL